MTGRAPSDGFTKDKFAWLDAVAADPAVNSSGFRMAYGLSKFVNRKTGDAWPSQETLAAALGVSARSIRSLIYQLVRAGYLDVTIGRGPGMSSRYRPRLNNRNNTSGIAAPEVRKNASGMNGTKTGRTVPPFGDLIPEVSLRNTGSSSSKTPEENFHLTPLNEPSEKPLILHRRKNGVRIPDTSPSQKDRAWAIDHWEKNNRADLAEVVDDQAAQFRDFHKSKDSRFSDWSAAWRTWARRAITFNREPQRRTGSMSAVEGIFSTMRPEDFE